MILLFTYYIISVIIFIGLYAGAVLGFVAEEELEPGKKYFVLFQNIILVVTFFFLFYFFNANLLILFLCVILLAIFLYLISKNEVVAQFAYIFFGLVIFFSKSSEELFAVIASLLFLYGLPTGSLYVLRNSNKSRKLILSDLFLKYGIFFVIAFMSAFFGLLLR